MASKDEKGKTPLHYATANDHKEIAELLIAKDADGNAGDAAGWTPLHLAVDGGHTEIAELLIAEGADVNAIDAAGKTPLFWVDFRPEIADILRKHGGKTKKELEAAGK